MPNGYMGKMVFIDLTSGSIKEEALEEKMCRQFIGGFGLGVRVLYERMKANVDPLGPDNLLGFVTGPLTGTRVPSCARYTVVAKSPLTGTWGDANSGGYFAPELKAAGYDAIFFSGISPKPVYLLLHNGKAELRDAAHLWGKDTIDTEESLRQELNDPAIRVNCIGPAGESQSLIAAIINDEGRAAARAGLAAVMGAKHLKAIVARGTSQVPIADRNQISTLRRDFLKCLTEKDWIFKAMGQLGTCMDISPYVISGNTPIKNWSLIGEEAFPTHANISGENVIKYQFKRFACSGCPVACGGKVRVDNGPYAIDKGHKPEYETLAAFGNMCLNDNVESIIKANDICNRYGLDTISAGTTIAFAMECYEHGIIGKKETDGIELTWGSAPAIIAMLEKIAKREGFGAVLADGVKKAAERIGRGAEKFAVHIHGQEPGFHDPRLNPVRGMGYIADATPGRHTASTPMAAAEFPPTPDFPEGGFIASYPELHLPTTGIHDYQDKGAKAAKTANYGRALSASGACSFVLYFWICSFPFIEFLSAVTGWDLTLSEVLTIGHRIQTLRQAFNIREGIKMGDFTLPDRIKAPPSTGPFAGRIIDLDAIRILYYRALDWDIETGQPSDSILQELGLMEMVNPGEVAKR